MSGNRLFVRSRGGRRRRRQRRGWGKRRRTRRTGCTAPRSRARSWCVAFHGGKQRRIDVEAPVGRGGTEERAERPPGREHAPQVPTKAHGMPPRQGDAVLAASL